MKVLVIAALVFCAMAGPTVLEGDEVEVMPQAAIDYVNAVQDLWVASKAWVGNMKVGEAKTYALTQIRPREFPEYNWGALLDHIKAPTSFDSRTQWPGCVNPILDQGQCGSCWAFGATEALSDRFCIASNKAQTPVLSPQYLVDCDSSSYGCNGGYPDLAWQFMQTNGVPLYSCVGYTAADGNCPSKCDNGSPLVFYKAASVSTYSNPASIQAAVMSSGPIEVAFTVYQDFMSYTSGVYIHTWGGVLGGHAVKLIGWGVSGTTNYWICSNSWGTGWGIQGFFWIGFGQCGIDSAGVAGAPAL
jgi:cathepsin B